MADHFRIGSNTKTFVVSVILQLIAEKKLSLDDPVSRFPLGVGIPNGDKITVRELCNMRSGSDYQIGRRTFGRTFGGRRQATP